MSLAKGPELQSSIVLQPMTAASLDEVLEVEKRAYDIPWKRTGFEDCIAARNDCWIICLGPDHIGHCIVSYVLDEAHLLNICVDPSYKRKGFGAEALSQLIQIAKRKNSAFFFLEVRESNTPAINLYHSAGFNEVGIRKGYYPAKNGRENAILMTLDFRLV